jgi:glycosyltransferase involved in cell wall biosynthesis
VKLAVFTSRYPAQVASFFERDMRSLLEAGVEIDVFSIAPLDASLWKHSLALLGPEQLPRERIHHLGLLESVRGAVATLGRLASTKLRDAGAILASAVRHGAVPFAKTAYVLPKAWTWAARHRDYDHVLAYWGNYAATCAYAFHRLAVPHVPFSMWLHAGTDLYFRRVFMRDKLLYADNIITCCEFNVQYIAQAAGDIAPQIASKVHVCHHGLDLAAFAYQPEGRPTNRIIAVGRFAKDKGYDYLVRAAQLLVARGIDVDVEFIGQGPEEQNLVALTAELGLSDRVHFRGWLPNTEVRKAMTQATVLVHPSNGLGDGLPNVVREAMAVGTPVIASDVAGIPDALSDGCGVLVPPTDVEALAAAIAALFGDPAQRQQIAARARRRVEEHYDMWRNGARLATLLRSTSRSAAPQPAPVRSAPPPPTTRPAHRFHDLIALDLLLTRPPNGFDLDDLDWSELRSAAQRGGALVRVADAVQRPRESLPRRFAEATAEACRRAQQVVDLVDRIGSACNRLGIPHAFLRTVECYPDAQRSIDLLIGDPSIDVDRRILRDIPAVTHRGLLHHRLAGATTYGVAYGNRLLIRHGRLGRLGEHARFARLLLARARPRAMGTATLPAPTREDHLLLLAMHQLYTRPEFRLSDLHCAIEALRESTFDWDYVFATALSTGTVPAVGCYVQYLDRVYQSVSGGRGGRGGRALVAPGILERFAASAPPLSKAETAQDARFPRLRAAARLYLQHLSATLESGRWHSAARLSLIPVMAALTAGSRRGQPA